jgi:hypothetical protein
VSGTDQLQRAKLLAGRVPPTAAIKVSGSSKRWLLWALQEPVSSERAERLNKRIGYHLSAPYMKTSRPDILRLPVPGSFLREGRARPAAVELTRATLDTCTPKFADALREPPDPMAWRDRLRAA